MEWDYDKRLTDIVRKTQMGSPYSFQRKRNTIHWNYPRLAQPNTYQPNQKPKRVGWGMGNGDYWRQIFDDYMKGRQ